MKRRKAFVMLLTLAMILSMATGAFAVSGAIDSDRTDYNTNRTGNSTATRQANSSNTGTIRLGKILTVDQEGKFPNIEDFVYKITPVAALHFCSRRRSMWVSSNRFTMRLISASSSSA